MAEYIAREAAISALRLVAVRETSENFYAAMLAELKGLPAANVKAFTNADKIRAMSDDELAMLLQPGCPDRVCRDDPPHDCYKCWLDWLRQEATP